MVHGRSLPLTCSLRSTRWPADSPSSFLLLLAPLLEASPSAVLLMMARHDSSSSLPQALLLPPLQLLPGFSPRMASKPARLPASKQHHKVSA